jgi:TusA-related sulfurtransferase
MKVGLPALELDARGMNCPLPLLKLKQSLNSMVAGQQVRVITTDAGSLRDFPAYSAIAGHTIIEQTEENGEFHFLIEKGSS